MGVQRGGGGGGGGKPPRTTRGKKKGGSFEPKRGGESGLRVSRGDGEKKV